MTPATGTALLILVAFVLPGFITLVIREATYVIRDAITPFERLLLSLAYSALIYGILLLAAVIAGVGSHDVAALYHGKRELTEYLALGVVAGYFGERSLAGYTEDTQDLFLEQRWELDDDGWFLRPASSSLGIWVAHEHIVSLEVYDPGRPEQVPSQDARV